jgi:anaerobic magnesium-protoporphyrin IX monomethyl ester cyclase
LNHDWVREFAEEVTKTGARIPFKIQTRANLMTSITVQHLRTAGCAEVWMGVESGSQAVLDAMDKGLDLAAVRTARERLKDAGIRSCYFLQFGYPGETWAELQETIAFVRETRPDDIGVSFSYPLPGTEFYERVREELGIKRNWAESDDLCIMFKGAYKTDFYRAVRDALHMEVDSWRLAAEDLEPARIAAMWSRVSELEPLSHNPDAFSSTTKNVAYPPSPIIPVDQLATVRTI